MKVHTTAFKEQIKEMGRELDSIITYGDTVLGNEELNAVTPSFQGGILKSVMKQLDIDSNVAIPVGTILNYKFGVKVNGEYEYLDFGNYVVKDIEKQEDMMSYKITCYDKMLYSMVDYEDMALVYPISIRDYLKEISAYFNLTFKNENDEFVNYAKIIPNELYLDTNGNSIGYTFRDVLDELAQVTASTICLNDNDELEIRYINDTGDTIDEEFLKNVNVNFGERYGKVNSIVLSRSGQSDNVYLRDELSVETNGLCEIKIIDNQIMNFNNRDEFLPEILAKLNGLEYYLNDFASTGVAYYDLCDRYNVKVGDNIYSCVMFNNEMLVTQGLEENIFTERPDESKTEYNKADKTDRRINQTYLIVDKQNQQIESVIKTVDENKEQMQQTIQEVSSIQNLFQITGGNNQIKDSAWLLGDDVWVKEEEGFYEGGYDSSLIGKAVSTSKIKIQNGKVYTNENNITNLLINQQYSLSYKISNDENTTTTVRLLGNTVLYEKTFEEFIEFQEESFSFITDTPNLTLEIESTTILNGFGYIYDLMLNKGDVSTWEPANGEIIGTVLKLSQQGLQIYCTGSDIATLMTAQGFQIRRFENNNLYEIVTEFTKDGFISKKGKLEELELNNYDMKTINYQGYETLIIYKMGGD